ncbi:N-acetyl-gamma-glutamyl-phosphate reductase [Candidatus Sumerlaeota bacterium]|nr:N-acetyl-gamma-glutamyl-phosphate reductase [Candidatus Sumerlaeota bacterium]
MTQLIRVSVLGATGYGGGEILRLLHTAGDAIRIVHATSRSKAGTPVSKMHRNLSQITDLQFSNPAAEQILADSDVIFGALPHGGAADVLAPLYDAVKSTDKIIIDLSGDFRLRDADVYKEWYDHTHPRPELLQEAVYGCPEFNRERIRTAKLIASPGCFATSINLSLLPVAVEGILSGVPQVVAMTGSSGSGADAKEGTHHPTRAQTLRPYKVLDHQHVPECVQLVQLAGSRIDSISFTPISAPIVRGILAVVVADISTAYKTKDVQDIYRKYFADSRYIKVLTDREPECASIAGTNFVEIRPRVTPEGRLHVLCALDNLVKGGAGQAVECLGIMKPSLKIPGLDWPGTWP